MTTAVEPTPITLPEVSDGDSILLHDISWETYERLLLDLEEQHYKLIYDGGALQIMAPSTKHEWTDQIIGRLIHAYTEIKNIPIASNGGTTLRRKDLAKGLEADESYYFANESKIRQLDDLDLTVTPPPDLAIEVEVTNSTARKMHIYAALGVPEIWHVKKKKVTFLQLQTDGAYAAVSRSSYLPDLTPEIIMRFVERRSIVGETALIREFRDWVNEQTSG